MGAPDIVQSSPAEVIGFWEEAGPALWFAKDAAFDARFRERFMAAYETAARGGLARWARTPEGALGLLLLLDQFPRNAFRGTPRMYATDALAREIAAAAVAAGQDRQVPDQLRPFCYLPFAHSEDLADQDRSVMLCAGLPPPSPANSQRHRDIVRHFGRFPHRNAILGRASTEAERCYLAEGGYAG